MRNESLSLRLLILSMLLIVVVIGCVGVLVFTGVLHLSSGGRTIGAGGALFLVAVLAAAISALGPKYRPTPFLTPMAAGAFAALLATTAVYAAYSHVAPKARATATASVTQKVGKAKEPDRLVISAPVIEQAAIEPDPLPAARPADSHPSFDAASFAPAMSLNVPTTPAEAAPAPLPPEPMGGPMVTAEPDAVDAAAAEKPEPAAIKTKVASIPTPVPAPAAGKSGDPVDLHTTFDVSGPPQEKVGPPLALEAVAQAGPPATPPLPRIRPCGGAGPACP